MSRAEIQRAIPLGNLRAGASGFFIPGMLMLALSLILSLWFEPSNARAVPAVEAVETFVLYDGSAGGGTQTPDQQGFLYLTLPISPTGSTQEASNGVTTLDTTGAAGDHAGYFNRSDRTPTLDRTTGYTVTFSVQVVAENHSSANRAGFSVIVLSSDKKGIELGFWNNEIWAQNDAQTGGLFTHGEGSAFDTTASLRLYELVIHGTNYTLFSGGTTILSGNVRDYTSFQGFPDPYEAPNFIFLGDDTTSAAAQIRLSQVAVLVPAAASATSTPTATGSAATTTSTPTATSTAAAGTTSTPTATGTPPGTLKALFLPIVSVASSGDSIVSDAPTTAAPVPRLHRPPLSRRKHPLRLSFSL